MLKDCGHASYFEGEVLSNMRYWKFFFLLMLMASLPALAQVGMYSEFSTTHISAANEPRLYGVTLGGYEARSFHHHLAFLSMGPDFRLSLQSGSSNSGGYSGGGPAQSLISFLFGPRLAFKLPVGPIHPYIEGLIGGADSQIGELIPDSDVPPGGFPSQSSSYNKNGGGTFEGHVVGGLDMKISKHFDWRMVEFSYGKLFLAAGGTPDYGLTTLSTGLVVRFP